MTSHSPSSPNPEQVRRDALLVASALTALALYIAVRQISEHPLVAAGFAALTGVAAWATLVARARIKDRLAAREDPPPGGVIIGTRSGEWRLAARRPYTLTWGCFRQHVLITGPTGRGKTYGFIGPILRGHITRPQTGVLYMDGKGDRIDQGPDAVRFDHVFCPEAPARSACWNPLAGSDPIAAARSFADALFPAAALPNPIYYEVRGAFALRAVAPAIAYTGYGIDRPAGSTREEILAALQQHGISAHDAAYLANHKGLAVCEDQLRWLPTRKRQGPDALLDHINRNAQPAAAIPEHLLMPRSIDPTIASLHRVLFTDGELASLAEAVDALITEDMTALQAERLRLLASQVRSLAMLPAKERAGVLSNLENRLSVFLTPPFDRLCGRSDFTLADVCAGRSIAMLLPAGTFPGIAEPLGRVALAQFQQAVLGSQPDVTKVAVLDEFHNFVSPPFTRFLNQSRSRGGAAVMSVQSIADFDIEYRDRLLANASTQIITPGSLPFDAEHWSRAFGEHEIEQRSETHAPRTILDPAPMPTVRRDKRDVPRYTPTAVSELGAGQALIRQVNGRTTYPAVVVDVERRHG